MVEELRKSFKLVMGKLGCSRGQSRVARSKSHLKRLRD